MKTGAEMFRFFVFLIENTIRSSTAIIVKFHCKNSKQFRIFEKNFLQDDRVENRQRIRRYYL